AAPSGANGSQIVFAKSGKTVKCSHDDVILDVAEANGIAIESQCRAGSCGTCKTMKVEGNVQLDEQQALTDGDIADGWVLACVGHPHGKVVLDL
ncbi:MAG TPA: 2Fe-2S iron-sulfur cluster binding domain-containing protein, partial [Usitatibacteraceae bacterium]|nr:2Fe-2S iron-sulfur cluster binding domain-containing protein [Usitatibacteraceae bacterium]